MRIFMLVVLICVISAALLFNGIDGWSYCAVMVPTCAVFAWLSCVDVKKTYLVSYKADVVQQLNSDGFTFTLTLKHEWFGLFESTTLTKHDIPHHHCYVATLKHWDGLIETKKELN